MENKLHSFEDLFIWKESMRLCEEVYAQLKSCNDYGLKNQMQRSAVSVPSNIAEGFELHTNKAFIRHLYIAKGSGGELRTQLYIARNLKYIDDQKGRELIEQTRRLCASISRFIKSRRKQPASR